MSNPVLRLSPASVVRAVLIVGAAVLVMGLAVRAAHPLVWFLNAATIAALAWPVVGRLRNHMPAWVAVLALTAAVLGVLAGLAVIGFDELRHEAEQFETSLPAAAERLERDETFGELLSEMRLSEQAEHLARRTSERFDLGRDLPGLATSVGGAVSSGFLVWILAVMLVFTGPGMVDAAVGMLDRPRRDRVASALQDAYGRVLRYLALTAVRGVVVGALTFVLAEVMEADLPALLAVVAALLAVVPYTGILLGMLPLAALSVLDGTDQALFVLILAAVLQVFDAVVLQPRIEQASFRFGMLMTLVSVMVGVSLHGVIGGIVGLFLAAMAVAFLEALGRSGEDRPSATDPAGDPADGDPGGSGDRQLSAPKTPAASS